MPHPLTRSVLALDRLVVRLNLVLAGSVLLAMVVIAALGVLFRFVLHAALPWAEEANMDLFVWLTALGAAVAFRERSHPAVDALVAFGPRWLGRLAHPLVPLALAALGLVFAGYGGLLVALIGEETGSAIPLSMAYPYAAIPYAGGCMVLHALCLALEGAPPRAPTEAAAIAAEPA